MEKQFSEERQSLLSVLKNFLNSKLNAEMSVVSFSELDRDDLREGSFLIDQRQNSLLASRREALEKDIASLSSFDRELNLYYCKLMDRFVYILIMGLSRPILQEDKLFYRQKPLLVLSPRAPLAVKLFQARNSGSRNIDSNILDIQCEVL